MTISRTATFFTLLVAIAVASCERSEELDVQTEEQITETDTRQSDERVAAMSVARQFAGICLQSVHNPDRIIEAAEALGWNPLPEGAEGMLAPENPDIPWRGWMARGTAEEPILIAISDSSGIVEGNLRGGLTCAVSSPRVDPYLFESTLADVLELGSPDMQFEEYGQRTTVWRLSAPERILFLVDAPRLEIDGATVTVIVQSAD